ncbi:hypothetical protein [Microbacterium sp. p3-SID336]|uniref:hypothetical protein n=1 Tax=Microbacterium sp. p3-SID336 TaxID=2916212 RepID=UPI0021A27F49|nr:hypothetical protein [Microbacterium sp. p3-SID336]MCT1479484.1 hypothetical protein [Microbacterium sp. p3-SID336]
MSVRLRWLVGIAAALLLTAGAAWLWFATTRDTPEQAALAYLQALESGDPAAVAETGMEVPETALSAFSAATARIDEPEVTSVRDTAEGATATVSFRLAGAVHEASLALRSVDGRWVVDGTSLGTLLATTSIGAAVAVGDTTVATGEPAPLLPAVYTVTAAPTALLSGEAEATVLPGDTATVQITAGLRDEATAAAQKQLEAHLATCTRPAPTPPEGCGIRIPWGTEFRAVTEFRYRIEQSPALTLAGTGFTADGGVLVATVTGTGQDGSARTATYRTDSWSLRGTVAFTADGLQLSAW